MSHRAPEHLSFSQMSTYAECSERYRLERLERVSGGTWFTTLMGSAIHEVSAEIDTQRWLGLDPQFDTRDLFLDRFRLLLSQTTEEVKASGKVLKGLSESTGGPNKKDQGWVEHFGPIFLERYFKWSQDNGLKVATVGGLPGIELPFEIEVVNSDGETFTLRGSIDRVYSRFGRKGLTVVDLKTGKVPVTPLQLGTYGVALGVEYGLEATSGFFWAPTLGGSGRGMNRVPSDVGGISEPLNLRLWNLDLLSRAYFAARRGIDTGVFIPTITELCRGCGVRDYCWGWSGSKALDPSEQLKKAG